MSVHAILIYFLPFFLGMIALELWIGKREGLKLYGGGESFASIFIGFVQQGMRFIPFSLVAIFWMWLYNNRLVTVDITAWWYWPVLFVTLEFFYYWFHRLSHEIRWLWATHVVHHSIEEMNVLAAYRFGWTSRISLGGLVYAPMMLFGFHPAAVTTMLAFNLMYQAWLHTTLIPKIPLMEGILNTPSAHRVHHAKNADYLDRNHGGVLMIFDRIFGTYVAEREDEPVDYGLVTPVGSYNPVRIAFHEWINIGKDLKTYSIRYWPALLFGPPGWKPNGEGMTSAQLRAAYRASDKPDDLEIALPAE